MQSVSQILRLMLKQYKFQPLKFSKKRAKGYALSLKLNKVSGESTKLCILLATSYNGNKPDYMAAAIEARVGNFTSTGRFKSSIPSLQNLARPQNKANDALDALLYAVIQASGRCTKL